MLVETNDALCMHCSVFNSCDGRIACGGLSRFDRVPDTYVPTQTERLLMDALEGLIRAISVSQAPSLALAANSLLESVRSGRTNEVKGETK